ncbi:MAG: hypothetical protein AB8B66_04695 [Rickettsiaceae bacterium]
MTSITQNSNDRINKKIEFIDSCSRLGSAGMTGVFETLPHCHIYRLQPNYYK